jgi:hypothetical protein
MNESRSSAVILLANAVTADQIERSAFCRQQQHRIDDVSRRTAFVRVLLLNP